jgi:hypothetical protein
LLRNGADPELREEDGKTPADKARERHDEGHREVLEILQSPSKKTLCFSRHTKILEIKSLFLISR